MQVRFVMFPFSDDGMLVQNEINGNEFKNLSELENVVKQRGLHIEQIYTPTEYATGCNIGAFYSKKWHAAVEIENID